jgi:hypothetical protein
MGDMDRDHCESEKIMTGGNINRDYSDVEDVNRDHCTVDKIAPGLGRQILHR